MIPVLVACLFFAATVSAAGIEAVSGETIPLSGYSPTSSQVYLFLTGPNLPANGVALNDITQRADEGHFTVVQVRGEDDSWSYKWNTGNINGRLDDGTYTVWVVNGPNDRSNLKNAEYGTISVTLGKPGISAGISGGVSAGTQSPSCSLVIVSDPDGSSVVVNGEYKGKTPLTVGNLYPGTYAINVTKFGYLPYSTTVELVNGAEATVTAYLPPERGTLAVNTTPDGAGVLLDGAPAGIAPVVLINVLPGEHNLTVTKDGYVTVQQQVSV
ncbi:MAG TPA: PEGA domain-containing protein, partial [Methanoregula sp.]|nr:PEGA domain-containing protein [Methanoregula sp.]